MPDIFFPGINIRSGFRIERTAKRMKQVAQQALKQEGLDVTVDQWVILDQLQGTQAFSQQELGQRTFKDAPTVTRIIDLLCDKGLICRKADANDRRKTLIQLTPSGELQVEKIKPLIQGVRQQAYAGLSPEQIDQLVELMDHIYQNLQTTD
ncbi:MAG: MarR family transcriptional regulator [Saprospiraceae bacterium]|nr:MarR family transcriptional regulator [Saprospiraceae bacterium]